MPGQLVSLALIAMAAAAACYHGPALTDFEPAHGPDGIAANLRVEKQWIRGELLELHDTAVVVLTDSNRVTLIRIADISIGEFGQLGYLIDDGRALPKALPQLRLLSRFPAGMSPTTRAALLAAYGQAQIEVVP